MAESAGEVEVEYLVRNATAIKALLKMEVSLEKVEKTLVNTQKVAKKYKKELKGLTVTVMAFGATTVGIMYAIIRASSYGAIYSDMFTYSLTRLSDKILEVTGLGDAIETFLRKFDGFVDAFEHDKIDEWVKSLTPVDAILISIAIAFGVVILIIGIFLAKAALIAGLSALGVTAAAGIALITTALAIGIGLVIGFLVVWLLWKSGVLGYIYDVGYNFGIWLQELGAKFRAWIDETLVKWQNWKDSVWAKYQSLKAFIWTWLTNLGAKFQEKIDWIKGIFTGLKDSVMTTFSTLWSYIVDGATIMKDSVLSTITSVIDKIDSAIRKIKSLVGLGNKDKKDKSHRRSSGFGGSWEGAWATGAEITRTGSIAGVVHEGEAIINLRSLLSGIRTDQNNGAKQNITINPVINISANNLGSTFDQNSIADRVSKSISGELSRLSTSI